MKVDLLHYSSGFANIPGKDVVAGAHEPLRSMSGAVGNRIVTVDIPDSFALCHDKFDEYWIEDSEGRELFPEVRETMVDFYAEINYKWEKVIALSII